MKKVLIAGYYGYGNVGDEALLETFAQQVSRYPEIITRVLSANKSYTLKVHGLQSASRNNLFSVISAMMNCNLFIQGGGGLIQNATSWRSPYFYLGQLLLAQILARRLYIMGQGIGPLNGGFIRSITKELFSQASAIVVRDSNSESFLRETLPPDFNLSLGADLAFLLEPASEGTAEDILYDEGAADLPEPILAVVIKGRKKDLRTAGYYTTAINNYLDEAGGSALFIPFFPSYDVQFNKQVMEGITGKSSLLRKTHKPSEILSIFRKVDHILAGRLHACIFSALAEKSFTTIVYDPKMRALLEELGLKNEIMTPLVGPKSIVETLFSDTEESQVIVEKVKKRLPPITKRAELNISKLLELLEITP